MKKRRPRILLVYGAPFSGHAQAAFALRQALERDGSVEVTEFHFLQQWKTLGEAVVNFYKWMMKQAPEIWGHLHDNSDYSGFADYVVQGIQQWDVTGLLEQIAREKPQAIVALQSFPLRILAEAKKHHALNIPLYAVTTDFRAHQYWAHPGVDHYFSSTLEAKQDLHKRGIPLSKVTRTGIPLRQEFAQAMKITQKAARQQLQLAPQPKTILIMGGSYGFLPFEEFYQRIFSQKKLQQFQWMFVLGNDQEALERAQEALRTHPLPCIQVYGFRKDIAILMRASDVYITKAGGLSSSEALAMGLPLILCHPLPGQEQKNVDFLVRAGAAIRADRAEAAIRRAVALLNNPGQYRRCVQAQRKHGAIHAADQIVKWLKTSTFSS